MSKNKDVLDKLDQMNGKLTKLEDHISSMKRCELIAGRRKVWDHLAELYSRAKGELLIMGEGADLSDKSAKADFERLKTSVEEVLGARPAKKITRIQTVDTWLEWAGWLEELLKDSPRKFTLYFTTERLKFVPQLNIRDKQEVVVVPPEESVDIAYALRIFGTDEEATNAIQSCLSHFQNLLDNSIRIRSATKLNRLIKSLKAIKTIQVHLMIACEFHTRKTDEEAKFEKPQYRTIQQYFTLDQKLYKKISKSKMNSKYEQFLDLKCKNLSDVLHSIFPGSYSSGRRQRSDPEKMAGRIVESIPGGVGVINPNLVSGLLIDDHIRGSALNLSHYLLNALFGIIQKI